MSAGRHRLAALPSWGRILAVLGLAALAGCGGKKAEPAPEPYRLSGPSCMRALAARGIAAQAWSAPRGNSCRVDTPVRAAAGPAVAFAPPLETSCAMLMAWADFEAEVARAALATLGSRLVAVQHYGSFACRRMTGNAGRLSLHARARALDISGFRLDDGRVVTVAKGWRGRREERRFLRAVAEAACRHFSVTLTPASDRFHQDHLHVDIGPWRKCGL